MNIEQRTAQRKRQEGSMWACDVEGTDRDTQSPAIAADMNFFLFIFQTKE
jgi:hypothetical protein